MKPLLHLLFLSILLLLSQQGNAQERPQETRPGPTPERHKEIRDSIRAHGRVRFVDEEDSKSEKINYQADRALLMPKMERSSIFRIGIPGWLMRIGVRAGKDDFEDENEYREVRQLAKRIRALRIAAYANNGVYNQKELLAQYMKYIKRKKGEPVMQVRAPGGGVQIHVKERNGKVKLISLLAYGEEGAAVIRLKSKIREKDLRRALDLMKDAAEDTAGVQIDTDS